MEVARFLGYRESRIRQRKFLFDQAAVRPEQVAQRQGPDEMHAAQILDHRQASHFELGHAPCGCARGRPGQQHMFGLQRNEHVNAAGR